MQMNMYVITRGDSYESLERVMDAYSVLDGNPFGKWERWSRGPADIVLTNGQAVNTARLSDVDFTSTDVPDAFVTHSGVWYDADTEGSVALMNKWLMYVVTQNEKGLFIHSVTYSVTFE